MARKEDPRVIRTQEMLKEAALTLLNEGVAINQLSVQKVTQKALLNRTTFYLHYQDINSLISQLMQDIVHELIEKIEALIQVPINNERKHLSQLLDYLYNQRHHLLILFQHEQFEKHLFNLMKKLIETRRSNSSNISTKIYVDLEIKTASLVGIIMWWLKEGLHLSSDYIAEQIQCLYRTV